MEPDFIKVIKKILKRQLAVVEMNELKEKNSLEKLIEFSRESFKIHWNGKNIDAIKSLDCITEDLEIPSQSKINIANSLILSDV